MKRYSINRRGGPTKKECGNWMLHPDIKELEAENARLRQQRDAANAQLDFVLENTKCDKTL